MEVYLEDKHLIVCRKEPGLLSQPDDKGSSSLVEALNEYLAQSGERATVSPVHRLDRPVGGCMIYAKSKKAAAGLSRAVQDHSFCKTYLAVVSGAPAEPSGQLNDLLYHDPRTNKTFVVTRQRKGVREAALRYETLATATQDGQLWSLLRIELITGRTHQIRVQFGSRGHALWGDSRYGGKGAGFGLWSYRLSVPHPVKSGMVEAVSLPPNQLPWNLFPNVTL